MEVEKKSSTVAKTALGLSIGALGVELLNGSFGKWIGNGGRFGTSYTGGGSEMDISRENAYLHSRISGLEAQKYTDNAIREQRDRDSATDERVYKFIIENDKKLAELGQRVTCTTQQIELGGKLIDQKLDCLANTVNQLAKTVGSFTKTVIPSTSVCNVNSNPSCSCCPGNCQ